MNKPLSVRALLGAMGLLAGGASAVGGCGPQNIGNPPVDVVGTDGADAQSDVITADTPPDQTSDAAPPDAPDAGGM